MKSSQENNLNQNEKDINENMTKRRKRVTFYARVPGRKRKKKVSFLSKW